MVAKLIVPAGPLGLRGDSLPPVQRRVVALELHLEAGPGNNDFCYTPPLGNRLWLHKIDMWAYCSATGVMIGGFFWIMFGNSIPATQGDIADRWTAIIPLSCGQKPSFRWFSCETIERQFTMAKLFTEDELRFGVVIENGFQQSWEATIAFEISEG